MEETTYSGKQPTMMRECKHHSSTLFRKNSQNKWVCIQCGKDRTVANRVKKKTILMEERGAECNRCGFSDTRALDWHHSNPLKGNRAYYNSLQDRSIEEYRTHTSECELICANCHRIEHHST